MSFTGRQIRFVLVSVLLSLAIAAVLAEVCLGVKESRTKKSVLDYADTKRFQPLGWGGYLKENLNIYVTDGLGGQVRWTTNAQGFRSDREFSREPLPGVLRILALGDSFNAGFRVGQAETLSTWRNEWINRHYGPAEILVAETEDPSSALYYLDKFGLQLKPQIVLLGITLGNDIVQAYQGLDPNGRYILTTENGVVHIEKNQNSMIGFEQLAAIKIPPEYLKSETPTEKFIRRAGRWLTRRQLLRRFYQQHEAITSWGDRDNLSLFDPNNGFGVFADPLSPEIEAAYQRLFRILEAFALICRQHHILFAVQIFPQRYQVQPEDWVRAIEEYGLEASRFNLMGPNQKIAACCREHGIICIDPTAAMAKWYSETQKTLYLPRGDMHWNKAGHHAFFECSLPAFANLVQAGFQRVQGHNSNTSAEGTPKLLTE
ncbi:MAG: SGNH/GDSL hydrolase family protein [Desulfobaccales bacterium]